MSESRLLDGKVAVISGGASPRGIGMATARMFAAHGARIAIFDLQGVDLYGELLREAGLTVESLGMDLLWLWPCRSVLARRA